MPKVKPAQISFRDGTVLKEGRDNIEYGPQLITTFAVEIVDTPEYKKDWRGRPTKVVLKHVKQQGRVPIKSWSYSQLTHIDWGHMGIEEYNGLKQIIAEQKAKEKSKQSKEREHDKSVGEPAKGDI